MFFYFKFRSLCLFHLCTLSILYLLSKYVYIHALVCSITPSALLFSVMQSQGVNSTRLIVLRVYTPEGHFVNYSSCFPFSLSFLPEFCSVPDETHLFRVISSTITLFVISTESQCPSRIRLTALFLRLIWDLYSKSSSLRSPTL